MVLVLFLAVKFSSGIQWTLLSSFLPCLAYRCYLTDRTYIQGEVTGVMWATESDTIGLLFFGGRLSFSGSERELGGMFLRPYAGIGVGYRYEKGKEQEKGIGFELFSGLERKITDFLVINIEYGVRYSPASVVEIPLRVGIAGGIIWYW